jgi:hypothetical protein
MMSLDTMHITLQKAKAVLEAATPSILDEIDKNQLQWLIHVAWDYVKDACEDLDAEMGRTPSDEEVPHAETP